MCTQTESRAFFFLFFSRNIRAFLHFSDIYIGRISRTKKKKDRLPICWFVHNQQRVKNHIQIHCVERGMDDVPLWQ